MCLVCMTEVLQRYNLYDSPSQQSLKHINSGDILALSNKTRAQTLPKCDEKRLISSLFILGCVAFATDCKYSAILFPVRFF